jgi:phospholipid/cholesterol/gamma-HCH transport system ATP-binding protein
MGFLKPDAGRVITACNDITDYSEEQFREIHKKVTMVFPNGALFDHLTVADNVAFPLRERGVRREQDICGTVEHVLDTAGAKDIADYLRRRHLDWNKALCGGGETVGSRSQSGAL